MTELIKEFIQQCAGSDPIGIIITVNCDIFVVFYGMMEDINCLFHATESRRVRVGWRLIAQICLGGICRQYAAIKQQLAEKG